MFERYAIFYTPTGDFADFGAAWLGWDSAAGGIAAHPDVDGVDLAQITATPRKYGFHATLKAPFRLAQGQGLLALQAAVAEFARTHATVRVGQMALRSDFGFVGLRPVNAPPALAALAADIVRDLDRFRAPLSAADITRRQSAGLTVRQDQQMRDWGYPFIFDDFHFHLTLTGPLAPVHAVRVIEAVSPLLLRCQPDPLLVDALTLMGQDQQGMFHQIHRYTLTG